MIVLVNPEGVILYVNPAIESILGYKPEERLAPTEVRLFIRMTLRLYPMYLLLCPGIQKAPVINGELRLRHKDGSWRTLEAAGSNLVTIMLLNLSLLTTAT